MNKQTETSEIVKNIREENRLEFNRVRKEMRYKITTVQRAGLQEIQPCTYTPEKINSMATFLRKRKNITKEFLTEVSQALAESEKNSVIFCGIDGFLQSLCSFLTGGDSALQLGAAYCVANAAVWEEEEKSISPLASITGAYLITLLGSGNSFLQEACCWALGNMLPQGKAILCAQGLVDKVVTLFDSPFGNIRVSAVECLIQYISTSSPSESDLEKIARSTEKLYAFDDKHAQSMSWMNCLLSFFPCCDSMTMVKRVVDWSFGELRVQLSDGEKAVVLVPLVRFLGNVCAASDDIVIALLSEADFVKVVLQLLNSTQDPICKETLLFVANIVNKSNNDIHTIVTHMKLKESLEKSVSNVLINF